MSRKSTVNAQAASVPRLTAAKQNTAAKKTPKRKRHVVGAGDIVMFHSPNAHMTGMVGKVTHVLSGDEVVVQELGAADRDYENLKWVVATYKPRGLTSEGNDREYVWMYVTHVVHRAGPVPKKTRKPPRPAKVLTDKGELIEHLSSDSGERVVYLPKDPHT